MCGIPMTPTPDAVKGRTLTFEQALEHIGGLENLVTDHGRFIIHNRIQHYLWKYRDKLTHCTACGATIEGFNGHHGQMYTCPRCGMICEFRHEAKGHHKVYDCLYLYEWRKSAIDPETIVLTGSYVHRNSTRGHEPHQSEVKVDSNAIYIFRPGKAVTVYKASWSWADNYTTARWEPVRSVHPTHTRYHNSCEMVVDKNEFRKAIEGTRIGAVYSELCWKTPEWDVLELYAIANCARRPWLEYLYKAGQVRLAADLMRMDTVPKEIIPRQRAKTPAELMGLTEGQWYEIRRDGIALTAENLEAVHLLGRLMKKPVKVAEAVALCDRWGGRVTYDLEMMLGEGRAAYETSVAEYLAPLPDKLRRHILRRMLRGTLRDLHEWRDYYKQLRDLGEDMTDPALMCPRDMMAMHERMTARLNAIREEKRLRKMDGMNAAITKRVEALRKKYTFRAAGLILRPYETAREIVADGTALKICIGMYVESYAEGRTLICCLRREEEPDEPWRAVQFDERTGRVLQDRGMRNDVNGIDPGTKIQLRLFWAAWARAHGGRKERKSA